MKKNSSNCCSLQKLFWIPTLKTCEKKRDVKRGSQKMRSSALTLVTQCRGFFSTFFLTVSQVKKKLGWGKKLALKIWNGRHFIRFTCFLFLFFRKIFGQQIFLWRFHEIFFLPFLLPKFSVAQPSPLHTQKTAVRVRRKKWTALCFSQLFSAEVYTRASRSENIHKHMLFNIYCKVASRSTPALGW